MNANGPGGPAARRFHPVRVSRSRAARGSVASVVLLSGMMRASMFSGDPRYVDDWFRGRQQGRWMYQHHPPRQPPPGGAQGARPSDPAAAARGLSELEARGIISPEEAAHLRGRMGV